MSASHRGKGIGTALIEALINVAREQGFAALSLGVEQNNSAARLYEKCGFRKLFHAGNSWTMQINLW